MYLCFSNTLVVNAQQVQWAKQLGAQSANAIVMDDSSNIYTTGVFIGNADFDPGPSTYILPHHPVGNNSYISKIDSAGNFVWASSIEGSDVTSWGIGVDHNKNVYISGLFYSTADFDPDSTSVYPMTATNYMNGNPDIFLLKLDRDGRFVWAKKIGTSGFESSGNMVMDENDNLYLSGRFSNTIDFDPGPGTFNLYPTFSISNEEAYVSKFDTAGNFYWAVSAQLSYYGEFEPLATTYDHNGNIFVGNFGEITKIDTAGNYLFRKQFNNNPVTVNLYFSITSLSADNNGNIYAAGYFSDTVDVDPDTASSLYLYANAFLNSFICKLTNAVDLQWATSFPESGVYSNWNSRNAAHSVNVINNEVFVGGWFNDTINVNASAGYYYLYENNGDTLGNSYDAYIVILDIQGNFKWAQSFGGNTYDKLGTITANSNQIIIAGDFNDTADFDPGPLNQTLMFNGLGNSNVFIVKIAQTGTGLEEIKPEMGIILYPNPALHTITVNTGKKELRKIEIYSIIGERLLSFESGIQSRAKINIDDLPSGMYLIKAETYDGIVTAKFLKQ